MTDLRGQIGCRWSQERDAEAAQTYLRKSRPAQTPEENPQAFFSQKYFLHGFDTFRVFTRAPRTPTGVAKTDHDKRSKVLRLSGNTTVNTSQAPRLPHDKKEAETAPATHNTQTHTYTREEVATQWKRAW